MLEALFGNKTIHKILIFLFVNGKCYGTELARLLKTPLTPIQKALIRLEKGGIIMSYYEGKTRLYQFDPTNPVLEELEQLLKKVHALLPAHEKDYYTLKEEKGQVGQNPERSLKVLRSLWERLGTVNQLSFHAKTKSKEESGWNGKGKGEVVVTKEGDDTLIFSEKGSWSGKQAEDVSFRNIFRWKIDRSSGLISLEHLRFGMDRPVFLFHLAPTGKYSASSVDAHLCAEDSYYGRIVFDNRGLRLNWRVIGPKKNEEIDYYYS